MSALHAIFEHAVRLGQIEANPAKGVRGLAGVRRLAGVPRERRLSRSEIERPARRLSGTGHGSPEIRKCGHQRLDRRLRTGIFRYPCLQLAHPVRERVDVECRRKPPLPAIDMQEAIVAQMIVHVDAGVDRAAFRGRQPRGVILEGGVLPRSLRVEAQCPETAGVFPQRHAGGRGQTFDGHALLGGGSDRTKNSATDGEGCRCST
ncbi:MAG: hypothetical protein ACREE2_09550 [Stellaceae bacterium]